MSNDMVKSEGKNAEQVSSRNTVLPRVDLYENDEGLTLVADMPGVPKDNLTVEVHEGVLTIQGRRAEVPEGRTLLGGEFVIADYARRFTLPDGIDVEKINADLSMGVLTLKLPKAAALKPRQIPISVG